MEGVATTAPSTRRQFPSAGRLLPFWLVVPILGRLLSSVFAILGELADPVPPPYFKGVGPVWLSAFTYFDAEWYLHIASKGYDVPKATAFYPLYPLLLRIAGPSPVARALWAVTLSTLCYFAANWFLYKLTFKEFGERTARTTIVVTALLPFSVVWGAAYTESLALLLLTATLWFIRTNRWWHAIPLAVALGSTRNIGFVLSAALAAELWSSRALLATRAEKLAKAASCAAPAVMSAAFMAWGSARFTGTGGASVQEMFNRAPGWPWWPIWKDLHGPISWGMLTSMTATALAFWFCWKHRNVHRLSSLVLVLGVLAMHLTLSRQDFPHTIGSARYVMLTFPFAQSVALAWKTKPTAIKGLFLTVAVLSVALSSWTFGHALFEVG
jgi:Mannosyltransferase (PIG-V)